MKNYLNLLKKTANSGFTLVELIFASMLTIIVVGGAGYGLFVMTRENVASNAASDTQYNLNRAAEFISDEVKSASQIRDNVSSTNLTTNAFDFTQTGKTAILALRVPGVSQDIIYYTKAPDPSSEPWLGPLVIYRWGPSLNSSGSYSNPTTPSSWSYSPLIDLIATAPLTPITVTNTGCNNNSTINNTSGATTGWTQIPSSSQSGFYICVNNTTGTSNSRKMVEIHVSSSALNTNSLKWASNSTNSRYYDKATYEVITQVYARSN